MVLEGRCLAGDRTRAVHRVQAVRPRGVAQGNADRATPSSSTRCVRKRIKSSPCRKANGGTEIIATTTDDKRIRATATYLDRGLVGDLINNGVKFDVKPREEPSLPDESADQLGPDAAADRRVGLLHAPDAGRRQGRRLQLRQEQGPHAGRGQQLHHLRRCGRLRRGQGRGQGTGRLPEGPAEVPEAGRPHPARRAAGRPPRHRQDAAGQGHRRRGQGAVLQHLGFRLRRDVRRRGRGPRARHVRAGQEERALHHLRRRNRRRRPPPWCRPGRRQRRARADAEPDAGRDGRLRDQPRRHRDGRHQPARHPGPGAAAPGPLRPPGLRDPARRAWPRADPERAHAQGAGGPGHPRRHPGARHARASAAPIWPTWSTRRPCSPRAAMGAWWRWSTSRRPRTRS